MEKEEKKKVTETKEKKTSRLKEFLSRRTTQKWITVICFLIVPMFLLVTFTYLPFFDMVKYSFMKWDGVSPNKVWVGFDNYKEIFTRPEYLKVLKNSIYYFVGSIIQIILALFFATILNRKLKGANFFKGIIFFPSLINGVAVGMVFLYFYKGGGTLDTILTALGMNPENLPLWLGNAAIVNFSLVFVSLWRYMGQNMVMFNGAIQSVNEDILEAASLDGANIWQQFLYIILPNIKMIVSLNLILAVKGAISVFEIPYIMTGGNNGSSTFVIKTLDTAFKSKKIGLASAMGVVLLIFIMIVTFIQKYFIEGKKDDYGKK
ncbi:MAG: carbohydrate ABC transporter permease [Lachnospiraceae bacterium]